jgi:hypothetical protein
MNLNKQKLEECGRLQVCEDSITGEPERNEKDKGTEKYSRK